MEDAMEDGDEEDDEDDDDDANGKGVEAAKDIVEIDDCDDVAALLSLPAHVSVPTSCKK